MQFAAWFIVLNLLYLYFEMPVFALGFTDWSIHIIALGTVCLLYALKSVVQKGKSIFAETIWGQLVDKFFSGYETKDNVTDITNYKATGWYKKIAKVGLILISIGVINLIVLPVFLSHPMFFNQAYRNLIGEVAESSFTADIEPVNLAQIRIVDEETAIKLAEKKIGEVPALGSEVKLGTLVLQKVKDKLYYVAPLEYRGFFQWLNNRASGSKGYIMISATNPQDVHLIQNVNGKDMTIKYQPGGYLLDYLPRYVYFNGFVNMGITDFSFEIDDDYNPYWIVTLYKNKVGYSGADAIGVVTVDAQTGALKKYELNKVPAWVDRIQPERFIYKQVSDWGEYVYGFWNSVFAKTGTLKPAGKALHLIYGNDGKVYWYSGITSSGKDESTVGFVMINSHNKEAKWYKVSGATETASKQSAEGQVQEKGYRAGYPILYNIAGVPTYIAPLKDKEGLLKQVAFISVENYNLVGVGADIESAQRIYLQILSSRCNTFIPSNEQKQVALQGKVMRFSPVVKSGESYYYIILEGDPRIFVGTVNISAKLPLVKLGDTVTITFYESKELLINLAKFEMNGF